MADLGIFLWEFNEIVRGVPGGFGDILVRNLRYFKGGTWGNLRYFQEMQMG